MRIFFSHPPKAKIERAVVLRKLHDTLGSFGHAITQDVSATVPISDFYSWSEKQKQTFYTHTMKLIKSADLCIFEVSYPSIGVGHLVTKAASMGKTVIALYTKMNTPFMLTSIDSDRIVPCEYREDHLIDDLKTALQLAEEQSGSRFHLFLPRALRDYLDWVATERHIPKSVFLRQIVEEVMQNDDAFRDRTT